MAFNCCHLLHVLFPSSILKQPFKEENIIFSICIYGARIVARSTSMIFDDIGKRILSNEFLAKLKLSLSLQHGAKFNIFEYIPVFPNFFL